MPSHDHQRRRLLRGALAAGCVLSVPMVAGCNPNQSAPKPAENNSSSGMPGAQGSAAPDNPGQPMTEAAGSKVSKAQAKYQEQPKADQMCGNCANFVAPNSCKAVEGEVKANGWCTLWARKQA